MATFEDDFQPVADEDDFQPVADFDAAEALAPAPSAAKGFPAGKAVTEAASLPSEDVDEDRALSGPRAEAFKEIGPQGPVSAVINSAGRAAGVDKLGHGIAGAVSGDGFDKGAEYGRKKALAGEAEWPRLTAAARVVTNLAANRGAGGLAGKALQGATVGAVQGASDDNGVTGALVGAGFGALGAKAPNVANVAGLGTAGAQYVLANDATDQDEALAYLGLGAASMPAGVRKLTNWVEKKTAGPRREAQRQAREQIDEIEAHRFNDTVEKDWDVGVQRLKAQGEADVAAHNLGEAQHKSAVQQNVQQTRNDIKERLFAAREDDRTVQSQQVADDMATVGQKEAVKGARNAEDLARANHDEQKTDANRQFWREAREENRKRLVRERLSQNEQTKLAKLEAEVRQAYEDLSKGEASVQGRWLRGHQTALNLTQNVRALAAVHKIPVPESVVLLERKILSRKMDNVPDKADRLGEIVGEDPDVVRDRELADVRAKGKQAIDDATAAFQKAKDNPADIDALVEKELVGDLRLTPSDFQMLASRFGVELPPQWQPSLKKPDAPFELAGQKAPVKDSVLKNQRRTDDIAQWRADKTTQLSRRQGAIDHASDIDAARRNAWIETRNAGGEKFFPTDGSPTDVEGRALGQGLKRFQKLEPENRPGQPFLTAKDEGLAPFSRNDKAREYIQSDKQNESAVRQARERVGNLWPKILSHIVEVPVRKVTGVSPWNRTERLGNLLALTPPDENGNVFFRDPYGALIVNQRLEKAFQMVPNLAQKYLPKGREGFSAAQILFALQTDPELAEAFVQAEP